MSFSFTKYNVSLLHFTATFKSPYKSVLSLNKFISHLIAKLQNSKFIVLPCLQMLSWDSAFRSQTTLPWCNYTLTSTLTTLLLSFLILIFTTQFHIASVDLISSILFHLQTSSNAFLYALFPVNIYSWLSFQLWFDSSLNASLIFPSTQLLLQLLFQNCLRLTCEIIRAISNSRRIFSAKWKQNQEL